MQLDTLVFPELKKDDYEKRLGELQYMLALYQQKVFLENHQVVIAIEGTDTAGKGGLIRRMIHSMDPRGYQVYSIGPPFGKEQQEHFLQRFWRRVPRYGQVSVFDRTWCGRVLVEKVELDLSEHLWVLAYEQIKQFEQQLVNEGIILIKLFLHISKDEQKKRFLRRLDTPEKSWKITEADLKTRHYWDEYQAAYTQMLDMSEKAGMPWHVIPANSKRYARVEGLTAIINALREKLGDAVVPDIDEAFVKKAKQALQSD